MQLEHESVEDIKQKIIAIVGSRIDLSAYDLFFFGSRVQGTADERSDIDVGVCGSSPLEPATKAAIEEGLQDLDTLYDIQFVDFGSDAVADEFKEVALQHTEPIS